MNQSPRSEEEIFAAALEVPSTERAGFVACACAGDRELEQRVARLLRAHDTSGDFLGLPASEVAAHRDPLGSIEEKAGDRIDRYRLLQKIGEGGCGVVWMAEQEVPIRRRVALKVIKVGMDTKEVIGRFETERQALALMDHPNVARVFDAGSSGTGRPYFVMELVRGIRITDYCDEHQLATPARLKLFADVCLAIQHAHQKGVIHRDIKPSNILVTEHNGAPVPKVIDFGIAKATQGRLTDRTLVTAFTQLIGTPCYMSPEQAEYTSQDVDTRSDIYSLGVLLYELLTGQPPIDPTAVARAGCDEVRRLIREVDPPRPSARLRTLEGDTLTLAARRRSTEPLRLIRLVHGDLDWIAMRCLEKNRARRYATADELARDIDRHLNDEPVTARPPGPFYLSWKIARRHRTAVITGGSIALILVATSIFSALAARRARQAEAIASTRLLSEQAARAEADTQRALADSRLTAELNSRREAEEQRGVAVAQRALAEQRLRAEQLAREEAARHQARARAEEERAQAEAARSLESARLVKEMLGAVGPQVALGRDTALLHAVLDDTAGRISRELTGQPAVAAELLQVIGNVYLGLGDAAAAEKALRESVARVQGASARPDDQLSVLVDLAEARIAAEDVDGAAEALAHARTCAGTRADEDGLERAALLSVESRVSLARTVRAVRAGISMNAPSIRDGFAQAEQCGRAALAIRRERLGSSHPDVANSLEHLARVLRARCSGATAGSPRGSASAEAAEAERLLGEALEIRRGIFGADHPVVVNTLPEVGAVLMMEGRDREAEVVLREALDAQRRLLGAEHPTLLNTLEALQQCVRSRGSTGDLTPLIEEATTVRCRIFGATSPEALAAMRSLEEHYRLISDLASAERIARERLEIARRAAEPYHPELDALASVAELLERRGKFAEAEPFRRESVVVRESAGEGGLELAGARLALAHNLRVQGALPGAEGECRRAAGLCRDAAGRVGRHSADGWSQLCDVLDELVAIQFDQRQFRAAGATVGEIQAILRTRLAAAETDSRLTQSVVWTAALARAQHDSKGLARVQRNLLERSVVDIHPVHVAVVRELTELAGVAVGLNRFERAEALLETAWRVADEAAWLPGSARAMVAKGFVRLYDEWSVADHAKASRAADWNRRIRAAGRSEPMLLDFLHDGSTTRQDVVERLGEPASQLSGGILCYRLSGDGRSGYRLVPARVVSSLVDDAEIRFSLVLTFDDRGILQKHAVVAIR